MTAKTRPFSQHSHVSVALTVFFDDVLFVTIVLIGKFQKIRSYINFSKILMAWRICHSIQDIYRAQELMPKLLYGYT